MVQEPQENEEREQTVRPARETMTVWSPTYVVLRAGSDWVVSVETARHLQRQVTRRWLRPKFLRPRWVRFVDISGAAVEIELRSIYWMKASTPESREIWRRFKKERQQESIVDVSDYDIDL